MHKLLRSLILPLVHFLSFTITHAQEYNDRMWVTNSTVFSIARDSNTIYLGGSFDYVYPNTGNGATINLSDGQLSNEDRFPQVNGWVRTSLSDGKGGWYIGGDFTLVQGIQRNGLAHILADNTLDQDWNFAVEPYKLFGLVTCMALQGDILYLGGEFTSVNGQIRNHLAAIDLSKGTLTEWNPDVTSKNDFFAIYCLTFYKNIIYFGGSYSKVGGQARSNLASVDAQTGLLTDWSPTPDNIVWTMLAWENKLYLGGSFNKLNNLDRKYLASVDLSTGNPTGWAPSVGYYFYDYNRYNLHIAAMVVHNNNLYVSGQLFDADPVYNYPPFHNTLYAFDLTTQRESWQIGVNHTVSAMAVQQNTLYIGGNFTQVDSSYYSKKGISRGNLAAIDLTTRTVTDWAPEPGTYVATIATDDTHMYIGGSQLLVGKKMRNRVAALDAITGKPTDWNPALNLYGYVKAITVSAKNVFVGGSFKDSTNKTIRNFFVSDKVTGQLKKWNVTADSTVAALTTDEHVVYLGGDFTQVGEQSRSRIAAIHADNGQLLDWNPQADNTVNALAVSGQTVFAGGGFTRIGGQSRIYLAALNKTGAQATAWNPGIIKSTSNGGVIAIAIANNQVYIAGAFYKIGMQKRNELASVTMATGAPTKWDPVGEGDWGNGGIRALATDGKLVYIGGINYNLSGVYAQGAVGLDAFSGKVKWQPFSNDFYPQVYAVCPYKGIIHVGGDYNWIKKGDNPQAIFSPNFAVFGKEALVTSNFINGRVFEDSNKNCQIDSTEKGLPDMIVTAEPGPFYGLTDSLGNYTITVEQGTYTIRQVLPQQKGTLIQQVCPINPTSQRVIFNTYNNTANDKDFGNQISLQPYLSASVSSNRRRRCFENTTTIAYCNSGSLTANDVKVHLQLPEYVVLIKADHSYSLDGGKQYVFHIGSLSPGQCGTIQVIDSVSCQNPDIRGLTQCTKVWITPTNPHTPSTDWDQSDISVKAKCLDNGFVKLAVYNLGAGNMADSSAFRIYLDAQVVFSGQFKLNRGDSLVLQVPANGQTVRLEAVQRKGHPTKTQTNITLEACGKNAAAKISTDFVAQLPPDDAESEVDVECLPIRDSYDPNDKRVTPSGISPERYTPTDTDLTYTIRFQNTGNDYAYRVVVIDTLSEHLDISTLKIEAASHPYQLSVSGKGQPVLTWTFDNIVLPDSSHDQLGSNGYVNFSIRPSENLPVKTRIENVADIFFDYNSPVRTNRVVNTIFDMPLPTVNSAKVAVCENIRPVIEPIGEDSLRCSVIGETYRWFFNGKLLVQQSRTIKATQSGNYSVQVTIKECLSEGSETFAFTVKEIICEIFRPIIEPVGQDSVRCSIEGEQYQWLFNGLLLPFNSQEIPITQLAGSYTVKVRKKGCLSELSAPYVFSLPTVDLNRLVQIFPNPNSGSFMLRIEAVVKEGIDLTVLDPLGRQVYSITLMGNNNWVQEEIVLVNCSQGIYLLKLATQQNVVFRKIVVK